MDEDQLKAIRAERRRQQIIERETAPSYWSAFSGWQWLAGIALLIVVLVVAAAL